MLTLLEAPLGGAAVFHNICCFPVAIARPCCTKVAS